MKETETLSGRIDLIETNTWNSFWNDDKTLIGYKDRNGTVKIEPRFHTVSNGEFNNIISVSVDDESWPCYYLTKSGKVVGKDSVAVFDNLHDCESEGFIRFKDPKTDRIGMFNRYGNAVIPAEYNSLTRVKNGMIIALKDAKNECQDPPSCEHYIWVGGKNLLIDTLNNVLIDDFDHPRVFSLFTIEQVETIIPDTTKKFFKANDESYYSFIDFEKEFMQWLVSDLLLNLTIEKLIDATKDSITIDASFDKKYNGKLFVIDNFDNMKEDLLGILDPSCEYNIISFGDWGMYICRYDDVSKWNPLFAISTPEQNNCIGNRRSNDYGFSRTDNGYKLAYVIIRS
jgi:hypothetical protein